MLENLRTRSGKFLVVLLALVAVMLLVSQSDEFAESGFGDAAVSISGISPERKARKARSFGGGSSTRKRNANSKNGKESAAAKKESSAADSRTSVSIFGKTYDEAGDPLKDVQIAVRKAGSVETIQSSSSLENGSYVLYGLGPDTYDILATHEKYVSLIRPSFTIQPQDESIEFDFHMPLGAEINGLVVNEDGEPLENVRVATRRKEAQESKHNGDVLLDDSTYRTQVTDKRGTFTVEGISQGKNVFEFVVPGYAMERVEVDVTPEMAAEQMKVTLKKTGIIAGVVRDENNNPISTATVSLTRYKPLHAPAQTIDKDKLKVTTDAEGRFRFEKLHTEGYYDLFVDEPGFAPGIYPLVPVNSDRVACTLGIGGEISGLSQLIDRADNEVSVLIKATAVIKGTTYTQEARSDGSGRFRFSKLPYGTYSLAVDDGKYLSEPKDDVKCERDNPARDVTLEIYETARVAGRVSDNVSDISIPGAKVTVSATYGYDKQRKKTFTMTTDAHGMFNFTKLPAGIHVAQAEAHGYLKGQTEKSQQSFVLVPSERKRDINLYLDHGASVEGFILNTSGRSVADVEVQLYPATQFDGRVDASKWKGKTDGTGYFKIWGIEVGERVQLYASASKEGLTKTRSDLIELSPSMMKQVVQINMSPGGEVSGIVTDRNEMPIPGAEVQLNSSAFPGDPTPSQITVHTAPNGTFRIGNVPPGGASLTVSRAGFVKQARSVTVRDEQLTDNINFELEAGQTILGVVKDLEGNPIAGARVAATGLDGAAGSEADTTNKSGEFELNNLGRGDFKLVATFKMATPEGEQNYTFINPRVPSGSVSTMIECDLGNTTSGKVKGEKGKGVSNFTVTLNSINDAKLGQDFVFNLGRGHKDAAGYFRLSKLPRGLYKLRVTADGYEPYERDEVAIGPHRRTVLSEIRLNPAGGVVGRVFSNTSDRPVNNASVSLVSVDHLEGEPVRRVGGSTNMRGEFRIATVPEGLYKVSINHPNYIGTTMEMIHVTERKERDLGKLFLEPGGAIRGTVKNHHGDPVPNMTVTVKGVTPVKKTTTDAAGNYLIQGIQYGHWPVVVQGTMDSKPMYTFRTRDIERDATERLDFTLETTADLQGRLVASLESPLQSARVQIHPFDENNVVLENVHYGAQAQANNFNIDEVPPGQYFMWVAGQSAASSLTSWKNIFLDRGVNRTDIELTDSKVEGRVMDSSGEPLANVAVQLLPIFNTPHLTQNLYNKLVRPTVTGPDGDFVFQHLRPGRYQVINQTGSGGWYAQPLFNLANGQALSGMNVVVNE